VLVYLKDQFKKLKIAAIDISIANAADIVRGRMINLLIDSKTKTICIELGPKEEDKPIKIEIASYELIEGDPFQIKLGSIKSDRPMYDLALRSFVSGKSFELPSFTYEWLKIFI